MVGVNSLGLFLSVCGYILCNLVRKFDNLLEINTLNFSTVKILHYNDSSLLNNVTYVRMYCIDQTKWNNDIYITCAKLS